ncbi:MAG: hypothetical protein HXS54_00690 [Theionarchaea archaeon]|nr:hypothetical protein [Theionarchaea archaeon]
MSTVEVLSFAGYTVWNNQSAQREFQELKFGQDLNAIIGDFDNVDFRFNGEKRLARRYL